LGGSAFQVNPGRKFMRLHLNQYRMGAVVCTCPRYKGGIKRRIVVQASLSINVRLYSENNLKQKGLDAWLKQYSTCPASTRL
jgi:hypothetical protein